MKYDAYIHDNGTIQVKKFHPAFGSFIDQSSPFVRRYLGIIEAESFEEAERIFGKKHKEGVSNK